MFFTKTKEEKLIKAVGSGDLAEMRALIEKGADVDACDGAGRSGLRIATIKNNTEAMRLLLEKGANPNIQDRWGKTPLSNAASEGKTSILKLLLAQDGIDVDVQNDDGETPLRLATIYNKAESVRLLLEKGANPDIQGNGGATPVLRAASRGFTEVLKMLLEAGANPEISNRDGKSPADYARKNGRTEALAILAQYTRMPDTKPEPSSPAPAVNDDTDKPDASVSWHVTDDLEIARIARKPVLNREITEIFNFRAERVITIVRDTKKDTETVLEKNFDEAQNADWLEDACAAYEAQTGTRPDYTQSPKKKSPLKIGKAGG